MPSVSRTTAVIEMCFVSSSPRVDSAVRGRQGRGEGGWPGTMQQTTVSSFCWMLEPPTTQKDLACLGCGYLPSRNAPSACLVALLN